MQSFIIQGDSQFCEEYSQAFLVKHKIASYNVVRYPETVKIADVRAIHKLLSIKRSQEQAFLLLLSGSITLDAQNAMLKTLEEVPDNVYIMILARSTDEFLPTILSRCQIATSIPESPSQDTSLPAVYQDLLLESVTYGEIARVIDSLSSETLGIREYDTFITHVRELMVQSLSHKKVCRPLSVLLHRLMENYSLVKKNNVNARLTLEQAAIGAFIKD